MIQLPRRRLLPRLFLETFAFFLLFDASLSLGVDRRLEHLDVPLQRVTVTRDAHSQRLYTTASPLTHRLRHLSIQHRTAIAQSYFKKISCIS